MKKNYILFLFIAAMSFANVQAQTSVLFVDDSDDTFGNAEFFHAALDSLDYSATYYNAVDSVASPSDIYMNAFDLVIWYTSGDGTELLLWNGLEEDNASLKSYLVGGGKLWLVGNDFLFDRYGVAPVTFSAGDFPYDYLGIASYDVQSYVDDGEVGVPIMLPDGAASITGLNDLTWIFATLWNADGVSLTDDATPIYRMGDANYVFADSISAAYHDNETFQVLTYFFDLAVVNNFDMLKANVLSVMTFFDGLILDNENVLEVSLNTNLFPNPTSSELNLELELENAADISISVLDLYGKEITELMPVQKTGPGKKMFHFNLDSSIANGYYFVKVNLNDESVVKSFILQK